MNLNLKLLMMHVKEILLYTLLTLSKIWCTLLILSKILCTLHMLIFSNWIYLLLRGVNDRYLKLHLLEIYLILVSLIIIYLTLYTKTLHDWNL